MSIGRVRVWNPGDVLTAFDLNTEFNNIIANPVSLWSPAQQNVNFNGKIVTWDSGAVTTCSSTATSGLVFSPGGKAGVPGVVTGSQIDIGTQVFNDTGTGVSGTAAKYAGTIIHAPTLSATNTGVTTTDAATLYVDGPPVTGSHETITNPWAAWFNGNVRVGGTFQFDGAIQGSFAPWSTGDGKLTFKTIADNGWVMMDDGTMGDAASGGTTRANADTVALFALLWTNIPTLAVSGGRGASAVSDYAAHKTISLPKELGRALVIAGAGAGLTARVLGSSLGSEDAITVAHIHTATDSGHSHVERGGVNDGGGVGTNILVDAVNGTVANTTENNTTAVSTANITVASTGSSGTGANMQPSTFWNVMVKL